MMFSVPPRHDRPANSPDKRRFAVHFSWLGVARGLVLALAVVLAACDGSSGDKGQQYIERGKALFEQKDYARAALEFKNAAELDPESGEPHYYLGRIHEQSKNWSEAAQAYMRAVDLQPDHIDANLRLARINLLANRFNEVVDLADRVLGLEPDNPDAKALKAVAVMRQGDPKRAEILAKEALEADPANPSAITVLAGIYRQSKRSAEALKVLDAGLAKNPDSSALRVIKIAILLSERDRAGAEREYKLLLKANPKDVRVRTSLAKTYIAWKRLDDAEAVLREAVALDPDNVEAKIILTDFLANQRGRDNAIKQLKAYIAAQPAKTRLRFTLAELHRLGKDYGAAQQVLEGIAGSESTKEADRIRAKAALAQIHLTKSQPEQAIRIANEVLAQDPGNAVALMVRARYQVGQGKLNDALATVRTILRGDPESLPALGLLSQAYLGTGQRELAADSLRRLIDVDPRNVFARIQLSQLVAKRGELEAALRLLDEALKRSPNNIPALTTRADILVALRRYDDAKAAVAKIGELAKGKVPSLMLKAKIANALRLPKQAEDVYREAYRVAPDNGSVVESLALQLARNKKTEESLKLIRDRVAKRPDDTRAWIFLGDLETVLGDLAEAEKAYTRAVELSPKSRLPYVRLVRVQMRLDKGSEMAKTLESAVKANPEDDYLKVLLALGYKSIRRPDDSIAIYDDILKRKPKDLVAANNFAAMVADYRSDDKALVNRALKLMAPFETEENPLVLDTIGWLYFKAGDTAQALAYQRRAIGLAPNHPELNYHLGAMYQATGNTDLAREHLSRALDKGKGLGFADDAQTLLNALPKR